MDTTVKKLTKDFILQKRTDTLNLDHSDGGIALGELLLQAKKSIVIFSDLPTGIYGNKNVLKSLNIATNKNDITIQLFTPTLPNFHSFLVTLLQKGCLLQPNTLQKYPKLKKKPSFLIIDDKFAFIQSNNNIKIIHDPKECQKLLSNFPSLQKKVAHSTKNIKQTLLTGRDYTD